MSNTPLPANRLIHEKSPYLLQHAHNPVDWYPWSEEAFQKAKEEDKPIFLSIGYATCHWCHVMEKESFENKAIAKKMNETFICIKVDREELPDVDGLYMDFAQSMMSGSVGWPLNLVLTPDLEPFFSATYLPPKTAKGMMGMVELIEHMKELWESDEREKVISQAEKIVDLFEDAVETTGENFPDPDLPSDTADLLFKMADPVYGGIQGAPKFPIGYQTSFLFRFYKTEKDSRALFLGEKTLEMMHRGGIYDHLGGGFSRYSVDEAWKIPHFEKMLYDNAILAFTYLEAWQLTKKPIYRRICEEILHYLLRDMKGTEGGFYSAEDADSEGREGLFYTWTQEEIMEVLGKEGDLFCKFYQVSPKGNFENRNILHVTESLESFTSSLQFDWGTTNHLFEIQKNKLWQAREKRVHPLKDDKILTGWNGLVIYSLAEAGKAFSYRHYIESAVNCARFIRNNLWIDEKLMHRWRQGEAKFQAGLDDYAYLIRGLLSLFEAGAGTEWLEWAIQLTNKLKTDFKSEDGAFYQTEDASHDHLIVRRCDFADGAEPSGNAIHTENLLRLYQITWEDDYLLQAEDILAAANLSMEQYPIGYTYHVMNLHFYYDEKSPTFVIALNSQREHEEELKRLLNEQFIPHKSVIWQTQDIELEEILIKLKEQLPLNDLTTLYICYEGTCEAPITDFQKMAEAIRKT